MQGRVNVLTENLKSESARVEHVRKENSEQLRSTKAEVKSLTDKIERLRLLILAKLQSMWQINWYMCIHNNMLETCRSNM